jgi:hypothetical protein
LIGGFALAVWLVWRKKFALKRLKKPNFQEIAFGKDFTEEAPQLNSDQKAALEAVEEVSCDIFITMEIIMIQQIMKSQRSAFGSSKSVESTIEYPNAPCILIFKSIDFYVVAVRSTHEITWCNL